MDKILDRTCSIENHPIRRLDEKFRNIYVEGLAACLYKISSGANTTKILTLAWIQSISPQIMNIDSIWKANDDSVKKAISLQRKGIRFFSMKSTFFFDVLYLAESSMLEKYNFDEIYMYLHNEICGYFSKKTLEKVSTCYTDFCDQIPGVDTALVNHRKINASLLKSKEKKVLVVANVSAGKSTLINALIGYNLNKTLTTVCTQKLVFLHNKTKKDGLMIQDIQNKYTYYSNIGNVNSEQFVHASFNYNSLLSSANIYIIDTPGVNNANDSKHKSLTENAIIANDYDCVIYASNCQYNATNDESCLLSFLKRKCKKPIVFVLNQLDKMKQKDDSIQRMISDFEEDLTKKGFPNPTVVPVSAQAALLFKLSDMDEDDIFEKELFKKRFQKVYYDLPSYIKKQRTESLLERTGIQLLEKTILNIINNEESKN